MKLISSLREKRDTSSPRLVLTQSEMASLRKEILASSDWMRAEIKRRRSKLVRTD